jgi:multiple sugar transport system ATP-binding protein
MAAIELDCITKRFDGPERSIVAVDDVDLLVRDGEFLVLVGPSGCGKSTTLRSVAGLETIDQGRIRIGDRDVTDLPTQAREIAMVFQNYALYPHKTVRENMRYGLEKSADLSDGEMDERVTRFAEMMGIADLLDKSPDQLSGGQKQRTALGRAIVRDPKVFLLDEPLSNLDANLRIQMRTEIQQIHTDLGITTLYVTHDQKEAMTMGDRIAVMNDGRIQQIGVPTEIYNRPDNRFVARFIGQPTMNFMAVSHEEGTVQGDGFGFELPSDDRPADGEYVLGIRPEDLVLGPDVPSGTATVTVTEPTGSDVVVYLDAPDGLTIETVSENEPGVGTEVSFGIPGEKIHLFDPETGETVYHGGLKRKDSDATPVTPVDKQ